MALKATIFKAELQIADTDRNYYRDHALTLARHPSETDERNAGRRRTAAVESWGHYPYDNDRGSPR